MRDRPQEREANTPGPSADPLSDRKPEPQTRKKRTALWHSGDLVHVSTCYPRNPRVTGVDRLAGFLRNGLLAPAACQDGSVCSDLHLVVTGTSVPYDRLVILHRFGPQSYICTLLERGRFAVFVDPAILVLTAEAMGANWETATEMVTAAGRGRTVTNPTTSTNEATPAARNAGGG